MRFLSLAHNIHEPDEIHQCKREGGRNEEGKHNRYIGAIPNATLHTFVEYRQRGVALARGAPPAWGCLMLVRSAEYQFLYFIGTKS